MMFNLPSAQQFPEVAVLYGGTSAERQVSVQSGQAVLGALEKMGIATEPVDIGADPLSQILALKAPLVFIALHGRGGEDGVVQTLLAATGKRFTGSHAAASALAMNKVFTKDVLGARGLATSGYQMLDQSTDWERALADLGGKAMVKPAEEGSSIGMSIAATAAELERAYQLAAQFDCAVFAEGFLQGAEFTVAILADQVLPVIQLRAHDQFYTYDAKYLSDETEYLCPAAIESELSSQLQRMSLDAFRALGCQGWGRVDLMLSADGKPHILEVNTVPGLTSHSLVPIAARAANLSFEQLILLILAEAWQ